MPLHGTNRHARRDDSRDGLPGVDDRGVGSPLLFLHAQDEGVAPIASARALAGQWMNARFVAVSGADHQLLLKEPETSTALPRRISVYEEGGVTKLATVKPTAMIALYGTPELRGVAEEVEHTRYRSRSLGVRPPGGGGAAQLLAHVLLLQRFHGVPVETQFLWMVGRGFSSQARLPGP